MIGGFQYLSIVIGYVNVKSMENGQMPQTPKKRTPVKKQSSIWQAPTPTKDPSTPTDASNHGWQIKRLQERLDLLERDLSCLVEHLSQLEDSTDCTQEEDEMN